VKAQSSNKVERRKGRCRPSLPIIIKFKAQVELKEMKEGASITVASSYEKCS